MLTFAVNEFRVVVLIKDKQISHAWLKIVMRRKGQILSEEIWPLLTIWSVWTKVKKEWQLKMGY